VAKKEEGTFKTFYGDIVCEDHVSHIAPPLRHLPVEVSSLTNDPSNARLHSKNGNTKLANTLNKYGQQKPVVFDPETRCVIAGNGLLEASRDELGWRYIAAVATQLDGADQRGFAIADNRTAEFSEWDLDQLNLEIEALELAGYTDFDMIDIGVSEDDMLEIETEIARGVKKKAVEIKDDESPDTEKTYEIVISCGSRDKRDSILSAIEGADAVALASLLPGVSAKRKERKSSDG